MRLPLHRNAIYFHLSVFLVLWMGCIAAQAGESPFGFIYTTDTQPKGTYEVEQWATLRKGKQQGSYDLWQHRTEFEYGVTNDFQASIYLNNYAVNANRSDGAGNTTGPYVPENIDQSRRYRSGLRHDSTSLEFIYRLWSPYSDPLGVALYYEPTFGPQSREHEVKLLLQKNFLDDRLIVAANIVASAEWKKRTGDPALTPADDGFFTRTERNSEVNYWLGVSYRFAPKWSAALEFWNHREFDCHTLFKRQCAEHAAYFLGPTLHYAEKKWWFTASWLPQLPYGRCYNDGQCAVTSNGRIYGDEHEKNMFRFKVGLVF